MPYPHRPYIATHEVRYVSGFKRLLVPYGDPCRHQSPMGAFCGNPRTYLDGGSPRCAKHLTPLCEHGYAAHAACNNCSGNQQQIIRKLKTPKPYVIP